METRARYRLTRQAGNEPARTRIHSGKHPDMFMQGWSACLEAAVSDWNWCVLFTTGQVEHPVWGNLGCKWLCALDLLQPVHVVAGLTV
eukprot:scaffold73327_cov18-Tisochrysis_lutea.AAC.1